MRFLHTDTANLPFDVRASLANYGAIVFEQAFGRFPHSGMLMFHHLLFLAYFEEDLQKTFTFLRFVEHQPVYFDVQYFSFKVRTNLATKMDVEDLMTASLLRNARRHHRNVLVQLVQFWQALGAKRPDINRLNMISRRIHKQRQDALQKFSTLLSGATINPVVFRHWGLFVETVLEQEEVAKRIYMEARLLQDTDARKREFARQQVAGRDDSMGACGV